MIKFEQLSIRRGTKLLFSEANALIHSGQKVGLVGNNGTGKSSLFALLLNQLVADSGQMTRPDAWVVAHVAQETPALDISAIDYVLQGDAELIRLQTAIAEAERQQSDGQSMLYERLAAIDGYTATSRAARLLNGLGFTTEQETLAVHTFSGGWRMRLNLAQALMCRSDLLLLDEPTNHLDMEAVYWLEGWLKQYSGTAILISHDRAFLDQVINQVMHISQQKIQCYRGNYSQFEQARAAQLAHQQAAYQKQQREIAHIQQFITRFKAKATKAKQAQSRVKALDKMVAISAAYLDSPFHFSFFKPRQQASPLLKIEQASIGYQYKAVATDINLTIVPGDRIGLVGKNGSGKSTLIKSIAGTIPLLAGEMKQANNITVGYFAQHQLELLDDALSPLAHLQAIDSMTPEKILRDFIGGFGFQGDEALSPVGPFSGGEKARLVLALLVYQRPALLLLDEPTNHLDLAMRHALTVALQAYEGGVIVVSHDRHFLQTVTDKLWSVDNKKIHFFDGEISDYYRKLQQPETQQEQSIKATTIAYNNKKRLRQEEASAREKRQPLVKAVKALEQKITLIQTELNLIEQQLAEPTLYEQSDKTVLTDLLKQQSRLSMSLSAVEEDWLMASEALDTAKKEAK